MQNKKLQKTLTLLVVSVLAAGIGCGEGKRSSRNGMVRTKDGGAGKATPGNPLNPSIANKTPGDSGSDPAAGKLGGADLAERSKKDAKISELWQTLVQGTGANVTDLEAGTYTFESTATEIKIMPTDGNWVRSVLLSTLGNGILNPTEREQYGLLPDGNVSHGYNLLLPASFEVEQRAGQPKGNPTNYILNTKLVSLDKSLTVQGLQDTLSNAGSVTPAASLLEAIAGKTKDHDNHTVTLTAWKTADSKVRFMMSVDETGSSGSQVRNIILTFAFVAKPTEATTPKTAAATGDEPPATTPLDPAAAQEPAKITTSSDVE